jgi:hypothetical protein
MKLSRWYNFKKEKRSVKFDDAMGVALKNPGGRWKESTMDQERFQFIRMENRAGRDAFVTHGSEGGMVQECIGDQLQVVTPQGETRNWDYHECEELSRTRDEFPWR